MRAIIIDVGACSYHLVSFGIDRGQFELSGPVLGFAKAVVGAALQLDTSAGPALLARAGREHPVCSR